MLITKNENNENEYYYIQCTGCQCNENHMLRGIYVVYLSNSYFMRASCSKWTFLFFLNNSIIVLSYFGETWLDIN